MTERIGVVGAGAWGTTLAVRLALHGHPVTLWAHTAAGNRELAAQRRNARYLPEVALPDGVRVATSPAILGAAHRLYILAVPSAHLRRTLRGVASTLSPDAPLLSAVKGIEASSHLRMSEVIAEEMPGRPIAVLSGPNLAHEIAAGKPAGSVVASDDRRLADEIAGLLGSDTFRVYTNADVIGVELCGALKNIVALAAGMVDGLGLGDSAKAGIMTRGLAEMTRLGVAAGANPLTFSGLAGVGDVVATCMSPMSRNHRAGQLLGAGEGWAEVEPRLAGVAEGVTTVTGALALAAGYGVELPIAEQVAAVIAGSRSPQEAVGLLMRREQKDELAGLPA